MSIRNSAAVQRKGRQCQQLGHNEAGPVDDSLTNLQWLQEFSFRTAIADKPSASSLLGPQRLRQGSDAPASPPAGDTAAAGPRMGTPTSSSTSSLQPLTSPQENTANYVTNGQVKPPYSYATLICMAMQANKETKLTLSAIYAWIAENFCYYRHAEPSWQNSIRHNLSMNKCFQKVPRQKNEPGKGGFWQINPQYADMFVNGIFRRRRMPASPCASVQSTQPLLSSSAELGQQRRRRPAHLQQDQTPQLWVGQRHLGKRKRQSGQCTSRAAWIATPLPSAPVGREMAALSGDLSWASVLEDTFGGPGSNFEDLELTAALGSLATEEAALASQIHDQPISALSGEAPSCLATALTDELTLCPEPVAQPWEEGAAEPTLGSTWAFEESTCFSEGFLAEIQPWEV
ncbi:forkhead box protein J1-B-like [Rhineura floridana]|uniref:forkhead box protein J1-B-like n=1 Tax=Rhineura floridana TaxID=261503 RepID=UPI002AC7EDD6|nr:forkhead box protein J1-B-like [Rhineura floridana]